MEEKGLCIRQPGELHEVGVQLVQQNTHCHFRKHCEQVPEELHKDHLKAPCGQQESEGQGKLIQLVHGVKDVQGVLLVFGGDCLGSIEMLFQLYRLLFAQRHRCIE